MKRFLSGFIMLLLCSAMMSCAKKGSEDITGMLQESFDLWMNKYHPEAVRLPSGMYVSLLIENPAGDKVNDGEWLRVNYTGRLLTGTVYASNNVTISKQVGYYSDSTHFVPKYFQYYPSDVDRSVYPASSNLAVGEAEVLGMLRVGETARIYLPYNLAYPYGGYSYVQGFSSGIQVTSSLPVQMDIELVEIIKDPVLYEKNQVMEYASDKLGVSDPENDYTLPGMYMKITEENPDGYTITADSAVYIYYAGRFLDGFVFDTNIDTVALNNNIYDEQSASYYISSRSYPNEDNYVKGFYEAIQHMRKGERATVVFMSELGYGSTGKGAIPSYTPLVFDIYVENQ